MKLTLSILLVLMLSLTWASGLCEEDALNGAVEKLRGLGFEFTEEDVSRVADYRDEQKEFISSSKYMPPDVRRDLLRQHNSESQIMYDVLLCLGFGEYDYDTDVWTPLTDQVYAFDAEVYDVEHMYTLFLQGVQAIEPDVTITDVREEFDWEARDGRHAVSFVCGGVPCAAVFGDMGDWIDMDILDLVNGALEKAGCGKRLYVVSHELDQLVIVLYTTKDRADTVKRMIKIF